MQGRNPSGSREEGEALASNVTNAASKYIEQTIALQADEEVKDALEAIKRRFDIVSTIRAFERAGYTKEFEVKQYMQIIRSRKSKPETKRRALDALRAMRESVDEFEPDSKTGKSANVVGTKAHRAQRERFGKDFIEEADDFSG